MEYDDDNNNNNNTKIIIQFIIEGFLVIHILVREDHDYKLHPPPLANPPLFNAASQYPSVLSATVGALERERERERERRIGRRVTAMMAFILFC